MWRVDLDAAPVGIERLLDPTEQGRASQILRETARRRWIAARGALRALIGAYVGERPESLRFGSQGRGKLVLELAGCKQRSDEDAGECRAGKRLHFNVSHSGGLAVYALTELCPVGIDVELLARRPKARRLRPEQLREWVRYEAEAKRTGVGIASENARTIETDSWIVDLDVGPGAIAAIALGGEPSEIMRLDWSAGDLAEAVRSGAVHERKLSRDLAQKGSVAVAR